MASAISRWVANELTVIDASHGREVAVRLAKGESYLSDFYAEIEQSLTQEEAERFLRCVVFVIYRFDPAESELLGSIVAPELTKAARSIADAAVGLADTLDWFALNCSAEDIAHGLTTDQLELSAKLRNLSETTSGFNPAIGASVPAALLQSRKHSWRNSLRALYTQVSLERDRDREFLPADFSIGDQSIADLLTIAIGEDECGTLAREQIKLARQAIRLSQGIDSFAVS